MYCPTCGNYNQGGKFCTACGTSLADGNGMINQNSGQQISCEPMDCDMPEIQEWNYSPNYQQSDFENANFRKEDYREPNQYQNSFVQPEEQQYGYHQPDFGNQANGQPDYQQSNYQPYNPQTYPPQQSYGYNGYGQDSSNMYRNIFETKPWKGPGTASLILGILSLILCCIPFIGFLLSLIGLITGIVSVSRSGKVGVTYGVGIAGLICSVIGLLIGGLYMFGLIVAIVEELRYY